MKGGWAGAGERPGTSTSAGGQSGYGAPGHRATPGCGGPVSDCGLAGAYRAAQIQPKARFRARDAGDALWSGTTSGRRRSGDCPGLRAASRRFRPPWRLSAFFGRVARALGGAQMRIALLGTFSPCDRPPGPRLEALRAVPRIPPSRFVLASVPATPRDAGAERLRTAWRESRTPPLRTRDGVDGLVRISVQQHEFCPDGQISCGLRLGLNSCRFWTGQLGGGVLVHPRVCVARSRASNRCPKDALGRSFALSPRVFGAPRSEAVSLARRHTNGSKPGACVGCFPVYAGVPVGFALNSCRFRTGQLGGGVLAHPRVCAARSRASNRRREDALGRSFALPPRVFGELGGCAAF